MLKTTLKITALSAVSLTLLSACGAASKVADLAGNAANDLNRLAGGNGNNNAPTAPSSPTAAVADRVVSTRGLGPYTNAGTFEARGERLSNDEQNARTLDDSYNITYTEIQDTFALVQSGENLVMTVNGTAYTFTPSVNIPAVAPSNSNPTGSPASYDWVAVDAGRIFSTGTPDIRNVLDGTDPSVQGTYVDYSTLLNIASSQIDINLDYTDGFATIGIQTLPSVVASQTATATYTGRMELNVSSTATKIAGQNNETYSVTESTTEYLANLGGLGLTMTANFTNNTIAGEAKYNVRSVSTNEDIPNREAIITFNSAPIVGNGFAGTFSMNADYRSVQGITNNPTGNYAGNFFGPDADDIAGVMRFEAQGGAIGIGGFRADRDTQ
ncbi:MAG: transferrin-binding protein-like solute binding protein [Proteobacteria bacterium]|nr:transferrin-binding protein-like solute binding protein [Pseudomonadota bacterium]